MGEFKGFEINEEVEHQLLQFANNTILVRESS